MPFMDGYEASIKMRDLWKLEGICQENQPPIYAVTGHFEEQYIKKALISGIDHVLAKPIPIQVLKELLISLKLIEDA